MQLKIMPLKKRSLPYLPMMLALAGFGSGLLSCSKPDPGDPAGSEAARATAQGDGELELPKPPPSGRPVTAYKNGTARNMTEPEAVTGGLTVIDLSNYWVPFIFSEQDRPEDERVPNTFRATFRKLANDWPYESRTMAAARKTVEKKKLRYRKAKISILRDAGVSDEDIRTRLGLDEIEMTEATEENGETAFEGSVGQAANYLEVFGIPPTLSVLRKRAENEINKPCFDDIDFEAIRRHDEFIAYKSTDEAKRSSRRGRRLARKMREEMERLQVADPRDLVKQKNCRLSAESLASAIRYEALSEAQKLLSCEGFYRKGYETDYWSGGLDWKTHQALLAFEQKNRIFGWGFFGKSTKVALNKTPAERLFDSFVRVIAERIIDATGIIENGTAQDPNGEKATYKGEDGKVHTVPNLVSEFTAIALKEMNLNTPEKVIAFLKSHDDTSLNTLFVALPLPSLPPYYGDQMDLRAVIDRGDVWYDFPYDEEGKEKWQPRKNMPELRLYVTWNDQDIQLVKMKSTIGGWRSQLAADGYEYLKYKNSDVGPRLWRDIVAGPVWLPPPTTPIKGLLKEVRYRQKKVTVPNYDEFGPWYASAYGLVAAFHLHKVVRKSGRIDYLDHGIRTHGSVDYNSILRRFSHGCHRLYNHLAIRLFDFVLRHKKYNRVGQVPVGFSRNVITEAGEEEEPEEITIELATKGYKYELLDPVPVTVKEGTIRGQQRTAIKHYQPKPGVEYGEDAQFLPEDYFKDGGTGAEGVSTQALSSP
ncbi:MAG: hypothetical protein GY762_03150 [Proteobacteria bacterium]|nr:hypothetical protein [Pseudomonadota bacterium]